MSLRAAFGAIVVGLVTALGIFFWTEYQTGRIPQLIAFAREAEKAGPPPVVTRPPPFSPTSEPRPPTTTPAPPSATAPSATSAPIALPTRAPTPTELPPPSATSRPTAPGQVGVTAAELNDELRRQVASGGLPLRNPSLVLEAPDRLLLRGEIPVAIFQVPVAVEAQVKIDDRGVLRVVTTRVDAIGASLPQSVATSLGQQIDELGSQAIQSALPAGAKARRVVVQADRVTVDLAP